MEKQIELTRKVTQDNFVTEKIDVIKNNLLGSYDENGDYVIPSQIIDELVSLKKIKKTSFGNSIFCVGNLLGYGEIAFELLFDSKTDVSGKAIATLFVLEDVDKINGYLQNTLKTKIDEYSDSLDNYINQAYDHFNVITEEDDDSEDEGKELLDDLYEEDSFILAKKQFNLALDKILDEKILDAYGKYFTYRISALTKMDNEFSKAIMDSFNNQYALIEKFFLKEKNYKTLNELLDKCIEEKSGTNEKFIEQEKEFNKMTSSALESFIENFNKISEKSGNKALNMLGKSDRHKIEEILEELSNSQEKEQLESVNSNVEEIINNIQSAPSEKTTQVESETVATNESTMNSQPVESRNEPSLAQKVIMEKVQGNSEKTNDVISENESFYRAFTASRNATSNKVVDTSFSHHIDDSYKEQDTNAYTSLKDRIARLEKFKTPSQFREAQITETPVVESPVEETPVVEEPAIEEPTVENIEIEEVDNVQNTQTITASEKLNKDKAVGSIFDRIKREKELKSGQMGSITREDSGPDMFM